MVDENPPQLPFDSYLSKRRKLPMWATVKASYSTAWHFRAEYFRIIWLWLAICTPIEFIYTWEVWPQLSQVLCSGMAQISQDPHRHEQDANMMLLIMMPTTLLRIFLGASVAVAWHRLILRNEMITTNRYLRYDSVVWDYFKFGMLIYGISISYLIINSAISGTTSGLLLLRGMLLMVGGIISILATVRLTIILPAKALQISSMTLRDAWEKTRGNFWRIFFGSILGYIAVLPFFFIMQMMNVTSCKEEVLGPLALTFQMVIIMVVGVPVMLTFLSLSFQYLVLDTQEATA